MYGLVLNLTQKRVCVVFRGTIGGSDWKANTNFKLDYDTLFNRKDDSKPGTHSGFTEYLFNERECDYMKHPLIDRIIASVGNEFEKNEDITLEFKF